MGSSAAGHPRRGCVDPLADDVADQVGVLRAGAEHEDPAAWSQRPESLVEREMPECRELGDDDEVDEVVGERNSRERAALDADAIDVEAGVPRAGAQVVDSLRPRVADVDE